MGLITPLRLKDGGSVPGGAVIKPIFTDYGYFYIQYTFI